MEMTATPIVGSGNSLHTGGFLNPDFIINEFRLMPGMSIADFGSGAGYFTILMAERVGKEGRVYALDIMESALDSVREKARASGLENVEAIRTNLEVVGSSGLSDQSQDVVLLANILFQSGKKIEIIREAKRVLKDSGLFIIIDWKKGLPAQAGAGSFGPPDSLRTDEMAMRSLAVGEGFVFDRLFNAGQFHFGMIFRKANM
ncbi:MAG: class I SAM-dependent methyltransferase [Candidatus Yanofskybacteria bacterium]|nr:class I SAM-dependent methyltransferase [Candidatus Yanofskybacteria bacterium]